MDCYAKLENDRHTWLPSIPSGSMGLLPSNHQHMFRTLLQKSQEWERVIVTINDKIMPVYPQYCTCLPEPSIPPNEASTSKASGLSTSHPTPQSILSGSKNFMTLQMKKEVLDQPHVGFISAYKLLHNASSSSSNPDLANDGFEILPNAQLLVPHAHGLTSNPPPPSSQPHVDEQRGIMIPKPLTQNSIPTTSQNTIPSSSQDPIPTPSQDPIPTSPQNSVPTPLQDPFLIPPIGNQQVKWNNSIPTTPTSTRHTSSSPLSSPLTVLSKSDTEMSASPTVTKLRRSKRNQLPPVSLCSSSTAKSKFSNGSHASTDDEEQSRDVSSVSRYLLGKMRVPLDEETDDGEESSQSEETPKKRKKRANQQLKDHVIQLKKHNDVLEDPKAALDINKRRYKKKQQQISKESTLSDNCETEEETTGQHVAPPLKQGTSSAGQDGKEENFAALQDESYILLKPGAYIPSGLNSFEASKILAAVLGMSQENREGLLGYSHAEMIEGFEKMAKKQLMKHRKVDDLTRSPEAKRRRT